MMGLFVDIEMKLKDITLKVQFDTGETRGITGILGASGSGKSMTLKSIAGIVKPDKGRIVLNGRTLFDSEAGINLKVQERHAGYLFQNYALFPSMTVRDNISLAVAGGRKEKREICDFYLELLQIKELACQYPVKLSGGQQQRVALARILASRPDALLLDEPFSAMDICLKEHLQIELFDLLKSYQGEILMVTHSRDEIYRFCEWSHILEEGRLAASGATKELFANPGQTAAARLTGCENIAGFRRMSKQMLEVPEWGITLKLERPVPDWADAVGIRAHFLVPVASEQEKNVIPCRWDKVLEEPFELTGVLDTGMWWKVSREDWNRMLGRQMPDYLRIPEESILFLRNRAGYEAGADPGADPAGSRRQEMD